MQSSNARFFSLSEQHDEAEVLPHTSSAVELENVRPVNHDA